ncbi:uncharacterized protein [Rutidosis leptorrhynchoides]|uniref:uncharacterized protein n=1 Tax=Rutidosis leptorrhynchoides TaxID=125765 RepID=UPI003A999943
MVRFRRVAEAFQMASKMTDCDSSGSDHSPETMLDLSDLVNSFIESNDGVVDRDFDRIMNEECSSDEIDDDMEEMKDSLKIIFGFENDNSRKTVVSEVEKARWRVIGNLSSSGSKRTLMARLRDQGLDAGICKSKWEKKGRLLAGNHEYIDVIFAGIRYIIILHPLEEFEIARPTSSYTSLLNVLPQVLVCKVDEYKDIVKVMSKAIKKSMNQMKLKVPPWRRREYVQAKWFGSYKRTINEFPTKKSLDFNWNVNDNITVGFTSMPGACGRNIEDFGRKNFGFKMGNLSMVLAIDGAS